MNISVKMLIFASVLCGSLFMPSMDVTLRVAPTFPLAWGSQEVESLKPGSSVCFWISVNSINLKTREFL